MPPPDDGRQNMSVHIILVEPEIPPNTGNIIRLAANSGAHLHLVAPLGFDVDDKQLRRAGLDYHETANMSVHPSFAAAVASAEKDGGGRQFAIDVLGETRYDRVRYRRGDMLIFGRESTGLPQVLFDAVPPAQRLFIPMSPNNRSLNLSNAVAILVMESWRQQGFAGAQRGADG